MFTKTCSLLVAAVLAIPCVALAKPAAQRARSVALFKGAPAHAVKLVRPHARSVGFKRYYINASPNHPSYCGDDLKVVTNPSLDAQARWAQSNGMISSPGGLLHLSREEQVLANARANGSAVYILKSTMSGIQNGMGEKANMKTEEVAVVKTPEQLQQVLSGATPK